MTSKALSGGQRKFPFSPWRKRASVAAIGFGALLLGCLGSISRWGGGGAADSFFSGAMGEEVPPGAGSRPVEVVEEGDGFRVVRHAAGTTRIPAHPRRICALAAADELLAIGVTPVAHSISDGNFPDYLASALEDVPWIPNVDGGQLPNMEAILRVHPDLILTRTRSRQTYRQLSKIAPVVVLLDHMVHYRQRVLDVGAIVGRRREAEARVAWYNAKVAAAKEVLRRRLGDQTMAVMRIRPKTYRLYGDSKGGDHVQPLLYGDLEVKRPKLVEERTWSSTKSPEDLLHLDADYLLLAVDATPGSERTLQDLLGHPVWRRVPAIRNGHFLALAKYRHWMDAGILGRARGIDDVLRAVAPETLADVNARADAARKDFQ